MLNRMKTQINKLKHDLYVGENNSSKFFAELYHTTEDSITYITAHFDSLRDYDPEMLVRLACLIRHSIALVHANYLSKDKVNTSVEIEDNDIEGSIDIDTMTEFEDGSIGHTLTRFYLPETTYDVKKMIANDSWYGLNPFNTLDEEEDEEEDDEYTDSDYYDDMEAHYLATSKLD